tara:strand:+ start:5700 stop:6209 length:510 start_codon:yes stop_codon:yes gene_type:complete
MIENSKQEKENHWINQSTAAKSCGVSCQAFTKWGVKPVAKIGRETFYLLSDVLANRLEHQAENLKPAYDDPNASELEKQRIRLTRAQADNLELKNEIARNEVAPIELLTYTLSNGATQIAAILGSIPLNIKRQIPRLTATEIETIKREIVKAQNAAAHITINFDDFENE